MLTAFSLMIGYQISVIRFKNATRKQARFDNLLLLTTYIIGASNFLYYIITDHMNAFFPIIVGVGYFFEKIVIWWMYREGLWLKSELNETNNGFMNWQKDLLKWSLYIIFISLIIFGASYFF